jgi:uncharacterized protein (TIGR03435 family)
MRPHSVAIVAVVAIIGSFGSLPTAPALDAQSRADAVPAFEVASVKPNKANDGRIGIGLQPCGRFNATNVTLKMLIGMAYGTPQPLPDAQLIGGPKWIDSDRFDVVAKAAGDPQFGPNGPPAQMYPMIRTLLADRFKLAVHHETRELPIYALMLARSDGRLGAQMKPAAVDCAALRGARGNAPPPIPPAPGERLACGIRMSPGNLTAGGTTMAQLATVLARFVDRVIVDRTALTANFDIDLTWTPDRLPQGGPGLQGGPGGAPPAPPVAAIDPNGPSIFTAVQEQLGLKLESTKGPVDVVVIASAEHPMED